jgi:hypothetical protein
MGLHAIKHHAAAPLSIDPYELASRHETIFEGSQIEGALSRPRRLLAAGSILMSTAVVTQSIQESANKAGKAPKPYQSSRIKSPPSPLSPQVCGTLFARTPKSHRRRRVCVPTIDPDPLQKVATVVTILKFGRRQQSDLLR